jgi:hypothetical protein
LFVCLLFLFIFLNEWSGYISPEIFNGGECDINY